MTRDTAIAVIYIALSANSWPDAIMRAAGFTDQEIEAAKHETQQALVMATSRDDDPRPMANYILPDGSIVRVDDTAAKGAPVIDYTLKGGRIVQAVRADLP